MRGLRLGFVLLGFAGLLDLSGCEVRERLTGPPLEFYGTFQLRLVGGAPLPTKNPGAATNWGERVSVVSGSLSLRPDGSFERVEVREHTQRASEYGPVISTWTTEWEQEGAFEMKGRGCTLKLLMTPRDGWSFEGFVTEESVTLDDRIYWYFWGAGIGTAGSVYHYVR